MKIKRMTNSKIAKQYQKNTLMNISNSLTNVLSQEFLNALYLTQKKHAGIIKQLADK